MSKVKKREEVAVTNGYDDAESPNQEIADKLQEFDYDNLKGDMLKKYLTFVEGERDDEGAFVAAGLVRRKKYDFGLYKVRTVKKKLYPRMKDSPTYVDQIVLREYKPVNYTRITVDHAILLNSQYETDHFAQGHGTYYLLKQVEPAEL